nr:PREDICTED: uncharacterized protein LOC107078182 isoform X3 [Lepisosteus oculatus]
MPHSTSPTQPLCPLQEPYCLLSSPVHACNFKLKEVHEEETLYPTITNQLKITETKHWSHGANRHSTINPVYWKHIEDIQLSTSFEGCTDKGAVLEEDPECEGKDEWLCLEDASAPHFTAHKKPGSTKPLPLGHSWSLPCLQGGPGILVLWPGGQPSAKQVQPNFHITLVVEFYQRRARRGLTVKMISRLWFDYQPLKRPDGNTFHKSGRGETSMPEIKITKRTEKGNRLISSWPFHEGSGCSFWNDKSADHLKGMISRKAKHILDCVIQGPAEGQYNTELPLLKYGKNGDPSFPNCFCDPGRTKQVSQPLLHKCDRDRSSKDRHRITSTSPETFNGELKEYPVLRPKRKDSDGSHLIPPGNEKTGFLKQQEKMKRLNYYAELRQQEEDKRRRNQMNKTRDGAAEQMHVETMQYCTWGKPGSGAPVEHVLSPRRRTFNSTGIVSQEQLRQKGFSGVPFRLYVD